MPQLKLKFDPNTVKPKKIPQWSKTLLRIIIRKSFRYYFWDLVELATSIFYYQNDSKLLPYKSSQ